MKASSPGRRAAWVCAVSFGLGVGFGALQWWPATLYGEAREAFSALAEQRRSVQRSLRTQKRAAKAEGRVTVNDPRAYQGYTLVCPRTSQSMLIDMEGKVLHRWRLTFSSIWPDPPHVARPLPDSLIICVNAQIFPNGDLLASLHGDGDTPYGYGLVKLDKDSNVVWTYDANAHHDYHVASDGRIYVLTQTMHKKPVKGLEFYQYPILADNVAVLSPEGRELVSIPLLQAFLGTPYESFIRPQKTFDASEEAFDVGHANSAYVLEPGLAKAFPMFTPGDILVSLRNLSTLAVINPDSRKVVWAMQGPWRRQHHAQFLPDGSIMLFDNRGRKYSRALEIDVESGVILQEYHGQHPGEYDSLAKGTAEFLPNGNLLVVRSSSGNVVETTPEGDMVWRYRNVLPVGTAFRVDPGQFTEKFCRDIGCPARKSQEKP